MPTKTNIKISTLYQIEMILRCIPFSLEFNLNKNFEASLAELQENCFKEKLNDDAIESALIRSDIYGNGLVRYNNYKTFGIVPEIEYDLEESYMPYITISNGDTDEYSKLDWEIWSTQGKNIKALFDVLIDKGSRQWDAKRKCWFLHNSVTETFIKGMEALFKIDPSYGNWEIRDQRVRFESFDEFFENQGALQSGQASKTKDELILAFNRILALNIGNPPGIIMQEGTLDEAKRMYRKAALALHPDRNNGDGTKMAELNVIWAELQTKF